MKIELTTEQEERLQLLLLEFMKENNIKMPEESNFVIEEYYAEMTEAIKDYLNYLNKIEVI